MPKVRIAHYREFDNGHVLHNYKRMDIEDAELLARDASLKDPNDVYYVKIDDVMNPSTDYRWINGKKYRYDQVEIKDGKPHIKESSNINIRKLVEARLLGDGSYDMNWKLMDYETASQEDIFGVEWVEEIDSSKPVYEDKSSRFNFWCYTNNDGEVVVSKADPVTGEEDIKTYDSYKDAGVEINEADLAQWQRYIRLANGRD